MNTKVEGVGIDGPRTPSNLQMTLDDRGRTHGTFKDNAQIAMDLRYLLRRSPNWERLHHEQQLALDEIMLKAARILSEGSSPDNKEHWHDISGYGMLGEQACTPPIAQTAELQWWGCERCNFSLQVHPAEMIQCRDINVFKRGSECAIRRIKKG